MGLLEEPRYSMLDVGRHFFPAAFVRRYIDLLALHKMNVFPSKVIHIGGDEVPKTHWKACPSCQQRIRTENLKDEQELQSYFVRRIDAYVRSKGREITGWDEILEGGLAPGAMVQVWRDVAHTRTTVKLGNRVVASPASFTYVNRSPLDLPLSRVHSFDPMREEAIIYHFRQALPAGTRARYVKVRATNAGPLPGWHPGAGGKAWIFADELVVR
jgi:hypothetical protein